MANEMIYKTNRKSYYFPFECEYARVVVARKARGCRGMRSNRAGNSRTFSRTSFEPTVETTRQEVGIRRV